jgi:hypothetical protein
MRIPLLSINCIVVLSASVSCTIQKRVYMAGYHIEWKSFPRNAPMVQNKFTGYSLNAYDALSTKASEESIISAENPDAIYCKEGTVIGFPDNAFVYEDGRDIKCSQVAVYVTEFYTMSDIIASGLTTSDNKRTLASAGMVYIEARCHGEKLKLKAGKRLTIKMPAFPGDKTMKAFSGILKNGIVDWKVDGTLTLENIQDENKEGSYPDGAGERFRGEGDYQETYIMSMTKLGWINCDRFYETKNPTKFLVKADSVDKTFVALIFKDIKSVLPGYQFANFTTQFTGIPAGADVTILAYRVNEKTKEAIVGKQDVIVGDTNVVQLAMERISVTEFKSMLKDFD